MSGWLWNRRKPSSSDEEDDRPQQNSNKAVSLVREQETEFEEQIKRTFARKAEMAGMSAVKKEGFCVECEDQEASMNCQTCQEIYCHPCFQQQHRKGKRAQHKASPILGELMPMPQGEEMGVNPDIQKPSSSALDIQKPSSGASLEPSPAGIKVQADEAEPSQKPMVDLPVSPPSLPSNPLEALSATELARNEFYKEDFRYIPLRLSPLERSLFNVLEGALQVSEYTDKVDIFSYSGKSDRILKQLKEMLSFISGLVTSYDLKLGTDLCKNAFGSNEAFFQSVFELGRRFKIMNPEKMRGTYGKLMYMVQDAVRDEIREHLGIDIFRHILTVQTFLEHKRGVALLSDPNFNVATLEATPQMSPSDVRALQAAKQQAVSALCQTHVSPSLTEDDIRLVIHSVSDSYSYQVIAALPVARMIYYLKNNFTPSEPTNPKHSLAIGWRNGAKLTHSHREQYTFVLQSLILWRQIAQQMFHLWSSADSDLLDPRYDYRLLNTGQGLNRVQSCPRVSRVMHEILSQVKREVESSWVGLSVVHLGDRDVPNALMFIDKYTQVARILNPIVQTLDQLPALAADPLTKSYIENLGGEEEVRMSILVDYFRHGFDGDGDDGGSCIDGRLTSTWNWCSKIEKKSYYHVFMLAGFQGFDGNWKL